MPLDAVPPFEHGRAARRLEPRRDRSNRWLRDHLATTSLGTVIVTTGFVLWLTLVSFGASGSSGWVGAATWLGDDSARPTARAADSSSPLGSPPPPPANPGEYRFIATQPGSDRPVTYDPCRPIHVVVNNLHAPAGSAQLLRDAMDRVTDATGFQFVVEGVTTEVPDLPREPYQADRYGDRWAPVVVAWVSEEEVPDLHDAAGLGGSAIAVAPGTSTHMYVTGNVILDGPFFSQLLASSRGWFVAESIVVHEFGHLLGLDHVDDPRQVMSIDRDRDVLTFGTGDLAGLAALASGPCVPRL